VYISDDLINFSDPIPVFRKDETYWGTHHFWAPEVHKYNGRFYMFVTVASKTRKRGVQILVCDTPDGTFMPVINDAVTPSEWECLDGTLYVDEADVPYLVFCHEHTQIIDGAICYARLNDDLSAFVGDVVTMFSASSCGWADPIKETHYVTDGPFMCRSKIGELFMIWSSFVKGNYAEGLVKFKNGKIGLDFDHLKPLLDSDGGHGMIFSDGEKTYFTYHTPNRSGFERPEFCLVEDYGDIINIKN
jgi:GH43 family beta-xylosidase